jgi:hypothetical protein
MPNALALVPKFASVSLFVQPSLTDLRRRTICASWGKQNCPATLARKPNDLAGERQGLKCTPMDLKPPTIQNCFEKRRIDSALWGRDRSRKGIIVSLPCPPLPSSPSFGNINNSMFILTPVGPKCLVLGSNITLVMPVLEAIPEIAGGGMS